MIVWRLMKIIHGANDATWPPTDQSEIWVCYACSGWSRHKPQAMRSGLHRYVKAHFPSFLGGPPPHFWTVVFSPSDIIFFCFYAFTDHAKAITTRIIVRVMLCGFLDHLYQCLASQLSSWYYCCLHARHHRRLGKAVHCEMIIVCEGQALDIIFFLYNLGIFEGTAPFRKSVLYMKTLFKIYILESIQGAILILSLNASALKPDYLFRQRKSLVKQENKTTTSLSLVSVKILI